MKRTVSGQGTFPLYETAYEHDSCGVGLVVDIEGAPSRRIVRLALVPVDFELAAIDGPDRVLLFPRGQIEEEDPVEAFTPPELRG